MSEVNFTHPNGNKVKLNTPSTLSGNVTINLPNTSGTLGLADTGAGFVAEGGVESTYESGGTSQITYDFYLGAPHGSSNSNQVSTSDYQEDLFTAMEIKV